MSAGDSTLSTARKRRRFQFSVGGLMVFVLGVAVGFSAASMRRFGWNDGVAAAALVWIILGLVYQACDLRRASHKQSQFTSDERWGWRFAVFWRLGVIGLLVGLCAVSILLEMAIVLLPEEVSVAIFGWPGEDLRGAMFSVAVIIVLSSLSSRLPERRRGVARHLLNLAALAAAVVLCVLICWEKTLTQFLVATAVHDIEMAWPLHLAREGVEILPAVRAERFFRECLFALSLGLAGLCLTYGLAIGWGRGRWQRIAWAGVVVVTLPLAAGYLVWACMVAMPRAFPLLADGQCLGPLHVWVSAVLLVLVLVTAGTYRLVGSGGEGGGRPKLRWRRDERRYFHERRAVILALAIGIGAPLAIGFFEVCYYHDRYEIDWLDMLGFLLSHGRYLLEVAVLVAAICAVWRLTRRKHVDEEQCPAAISPRHFAAVWFALLVSIAVVVPALMLVAFGLWFSPWYRGGWP